MSTRWIRFFLNLTGAQERLGARLGLQASALGGHLEGTWLCWRPDQNLPALAGSGASGKAFQGGAKCFGSCLPQHQGPIPRLPDQPRGEGAFGVATVAVGELQDFLPRLRLRSVAVGALAARQWEVGDQRPDGVGPVTVAGGDLVGLHAKGAGPWPSYGDIAQNL